MAVLQTKLLGVCSNWSIATGPCFSSLPDLLMALAVGQENVQMHLPGPQFPLVVA